MFNKFIGWTSGSRHLVTYVSNDSLRATEIEIGDTLTYKFTTAGKNIINKTGVTQFYMLTDVDISRYDSPTSTGYNTTVFQDDSPYLQVWYTEVGLTINGVANVTKFNGVTFSKVNGVSP